MKPHTDPFPSSYTALGYLSCGRRCLARISCVHIRQLSFNGKFVVHLVPLSSFFVVFYRKERYSCYEFIYSTVVALRRDVKLCLGHGLKLHLALSRLRQVDLVLISTSTSLGLGLHLPIDIVRSPVRYDFHTMSNHFNYQLLELSIMASRWMVPSPIIRDCL